MAPEEETSTIKVVLARAGYGLLNQVVFNLRLSSYEYECQGPAPFLAKIIID